MRYSYLRDPSGAYPRVPMLISMALGYYKGTKRLWERFKGII